LVEVLKEGSVDVPAARRLETPVWLNGRTIFGLLLFCSAVLGGQRLIASSSTTTLMWAATHDLAQDSVIQIDDLRAVEVRLPGDLASAYISASQALEGSIVRRAVLEGELLHSAWLADEPTGGAGRSMTLPVSPEHAVGGDLRTGDRVDVYATFDPGDARARTTLLARDVEIVEVVTAGGFALDEEALIGITVSVSPEEATRLAFAIRTAELDVVRITGETGLGSTSTVRAGDFP
jgi:Flp pilus assembly protein CpaB